MKKKGWKIYLLIFYIIFLLLYLDLKIYAYHEIREGEEKAYYIIKKSFNYTPNNIILYNYKAIFNNVNNERLGIEVDSYYKNYDDDKLTNKYEKDIKKFLKNKMQYRQINEFFQQNIFSSNDTFLQRAYKIYEWVNKNIKYEISFDNKQNPLTVFTSRKGDCLGYSKLMVYLFRLGNIPAKIYFSYLYDKKYNPAFDSLNEDIFHAVIAIYFHRYGWIAMEPQKMFLNITAKHILIFPEDHIPEGKILYRENKKSGEKIFLTERDKNNYLKSLFLDKFIKTIDGSLVEYMPNYQITNLSTIFKNNKGITSPNPIFNTTLFGKIELQTKKKIKEIWLVSLKNSMLMKLEFLDKNKVLKLYSNDIQLFTLYNGKNLNIFGLPEGNYLLYYVYKGLPYRMFSLQYNNNQSKLTEYFVNYLLKSGNFKKVKIDFPNGSYIDIDKKMTGFTTIEGLTIKNFPIYIDYNDKYFFIFGLKQSKYYFYLYGKKIEYVTF